MIRTATIEDLPELHRMGKEFVSVTGYEGFSSYDFDSANDVFIELIRIGTILIDGKNGMMGFMVFPVFFDKKSLIAQELFWWVDVEKRGSILGVKMLKMAENIAKDLGAKAFLMLSIHGLNGSKVNNLYKRMGYREHEETYIRGL